MNPQPGIDIPVAEEPVDNEPLTDQELKRLAKAIREVECGETVSWEEIQRKHDL